MVLHTEECCRVAKHFFSHPVLLPARSPYYFVARTFRPRLADCKACKTSVQPLLQMKGRLSRQHVGTRGRLRGRADRRPQEGTQLWREKGLGRLEERAPAGQENFVRWPAVKRSPVDRVRRAFDSAHVRKSWLMLGNLALRLCLS